MRQFRPGDGTRPWLAWLKHRRGWMGGGLPTQSVQRVTQTDEDRMTEDGELRFTEGT